MTGCLACTRRIDALKARLRAFRSDEHGSMVMFGVMLLILMLAIAGMAVDISRSELTRVRVQNTLDRATLAAADLDQTLSPEAVVRDYLVKAGLDPNVAVINVSEEFFAEGDDEVAARRVSASIDTEIDAIFLRMVGIDEIPVATAAVAEESVANVEISLVLDISGSMRFNNQIGLLRPAAKRFVEIVLEGRAAETTSINLVPYAGQVNVGPFLFDRWGGTRGHSNSSCVELQADDYTTMAPPPAGRAQVPHFMNWAIDAATMDWGWCPRDATQMRIAQNDVESLSQFIDTMRLHDGTGTQNGMKYGLMLLNPNEQSTFAALAAAGHIPDEFADRPVAWNSDQGAGDISRKYIVLMTDGEITDQIRPRYTGLRDTDSDSLDNEKVNGVNDPDTADGTDHELWNRTVELQNQPANNRTTALTVRATNVTRFYAQCDLAKAQGVTVFTIAFNANANAQTEMRNCASSPAHYYNASLLDVDNAFAAIARTINKLRLTQ